MISLILIIKILTNLIAVNLNSFLKQRKICNSFGFLWVYKCLKHQGYQYALSLHCYNFLLRDGLSFVEGACSGKSIKLENFCIFG